MAVAHVSWSGLNTAQTVLHVSDSPYLFLILRVIRRGDLPIVSFGRRTWHTRLTCTRQDWQTLPRWVFWTMLQPFLKPISMNSWGAEGPRALMCCFFLVCSRLPCSTLSTSASFPLLCTEGRPCARQDAVQGIGGQYESASITSLLPVVTASEGSARFHSSLLPGCALRCCCREALVPRDPCSPSPCRCSRCFSGQLGSWTWSADDSPCSPQLLLLPLLPWPSPGASVLLPMVSLQMWPFPSISEPGVCGFSAGRMRGLLHASPFPLGNCYSFHFSLIQSDHLSGVLLGKCSTKPVCSNLHL